MKMNKTIVAGAVTILMSSVGVHAADQGTGVVNFKGTVIDAPCGIDPNSADQTIDFGQISKTFLQNGGKSATKDVDIKLVNCDVTTVKKGVKVTFTGNTASDATQLLTGGNTGTAIMLNGYNSNISFGTPTDNITLQDGTSMLHFVSWVEKAANATVAEGDFSATANFSLAYE